jgi:hypothetical protein
MKTKYDSPMQRDILVIYAITFLTIICGTVWWTLTHPETISNNQQLNPSQVQNSKSNYNATDFK